MDRKVTSTGMLEVKGVAISPALARDGEEIVVWHQAKRMSSR